MQLLGFKCWLHCCVIYVDFSDVPAVFDSKHDLEVQSVCELSSRVLHVCLGCCLLVVVGKHAGLASFTEDEDVSKMC